MAFNGGVQVAEPRFSMIHTTFCAEISVRFTTRRTRKSFELKRGVSLKIAGKYRAVELGRRGISVNGNGLKQEGPLLLGKVKKIQPLNHLWAFLLYLFDVSFFFLSFFFFHESPMALKLKNSYKRSNNLHVGIINLKKSRLIRRWMLIFFQLDKNSKK